jgi:reverse gyrase
MIDIVEYVETYLGIKLFEYQKIFLRNCVETKNWYITYPPRCGRTFFMEMLNEWNKLNESKN